MKETKETVASPSVRAAASPKSSGLALPAPAGGPPLIQAKLLVGHPDDPLEHEADRAAERVVSLWQGGGFRHPSGNAPTPSGVPLIQRRAASPAAGAVQASPQISSQIETARGSGQALPAALQPSLEAAFGMDFSGVRLHTDARADALNRSLQARAFTTGRDIFFREGAYRPHTAEGVRLLGHELGHVGQQGNRANWYIARRLLSPSEAQAAVQRYRLGLRFRPLLPSSSGAGYSLERPYRALQGQSLQIEFLSRIENIGGPGPIIWPMWRIQSPDGTLSDRSGPTTQYSFQLAQPGTYRIMATPEIRASVSGAENDFVIMTRFVRAESPRSLANDALDRLVFPDLNQLRGQYESRRERLRASEALRRNIIRQNGISKIQGPVHNPITYGSRMGRADSGLGPFFLASSWVDRPNTSFRWFHTIFGTPQQASRRERFMFHGNPIYGNRLPEVGREGINFQITGPGLFSVFCQQVERTSEGRTETVIEEHAYHQVVVNPEEEREEARSTHEMLTRIQHMWESSTIGGGDRITLRAVHVNLVSAQVNSLNLYLRQGPDSNVELYDLTPGVLRTDYRAGTLNEVLRAFDQGNSYPRGLIRIRIPENSQGFPAGPVYPDIQTTGTTAAADMAGVFGRMSLGTMAAGLVAMIIPGGQGVGALILGSSAMLGALSGAMQLADDLSRDRVSSTAVILDILDIAGSLLSFAGTIATGRARQLTSLIDLSVTGTEAIMLGPQLLEDIERVTQSASSPEEKRRQLYVILANGVISGAMYYHSARSSVADLSIPPRRQRNPDGRRSDESPSSLDDTGHSESGIRAAIESGNLSAYVEAIRAERRRSLGGRSWDYAAFPNSGGLTWQPGLPIDMPNHLGVYPTYSTARSRYWRNRAHHELMERQLGHSAQDLNAGDDPISQMSDAELSTLRDTPTADVRSPRLDSGRAMELEHMGVPQRVAGWLQGITVNGRTIFTPSEARRIAEVANPTYLFETDPLGHAFYDYWANQYPGRADAFGRRPMTTPLSDERVYSPLSRMPDSNIRSIVERLNEHVGQEINIPIDLRQGLERIIRERPSLADLTLPS